MKADLPTLVSGYRNQWVPASCELQLIKRKGGIIRLIDIITLFREGSTLKPKQYLELRKEGDMMEKKIIKRVSVLLMVCMLMASTVVFAFAANVQDTEYYEKNVAAGSYRPTESRYKTNTSKVYVYPSYSPSSRTMVKTMCYDAGVVANKTNTPIGYAVLTSGTKYAISNFVYEQGDYTTGYGVNMWLRISPTASKGTLRGVWSPDWTGAGTGVVII